MAAHNHVFLLLGSDIEPRLQNLRQAINKLKLNNCDVKLTSSVYESEAWGFTSDQKFLNQVVIVDTDLEPIELLNCILKIEKDLGRTRGKKSVYTSRNIDIDILYFNDQLINKSELVIPHPRLYKRRFALEPLVEVAPDYEHPVLKKTNEELLEGIKDSSVVNKFIEKEICGDEI